MSDRDGPKAIIVHLSDLHTRARIPGDYVAATVEAVRSLQADPVLCVVAVTGDLSGEGRADQFEDAVEFLTSIKDALQVELGCQISVLAVPGNHDCDFSGAHGVRALVLESLQPGDSEKLLPDVVAEVTGVQDNFFEALAPCVEGLPADKGHRLAWTVTYECAGRFITFVCCNTAWMSTLKEEQAHLWFPNDVAKSRDDGGWHVTLFHHPFPWLQSTNAREFTKTIESFSNVVLTGHDHDPGTFRKERVDGATAFVEGGVYIDPGSAFNVVILDLETGEASATEFKLEGERYEEVRTWTILPAAGRRESAIPVLRASFADYIRDPGARFVHKAKELDLADVFVAPPLRRFEPNLATKTFDAEVVGSEHTIGRLLEDKRAYVAGESQSGKTCLAKVLFDECYERELVPLILKGADLKSPDAKKLRAEVAKAFIAQYEETSPDPYLRLPAEKRVLIVDDFGRARLRKEDRVRLCGLLAAEADSVFIFGDDVAQVEELVLTGSSPSIDQNYAAYDVLPLGHEARDNLIEKWVLLDETAALNEEFAAYKINHYTAVVNSVLGNNLLPSYPFFVLGVLQQLDLGEGLDIKAGAQGYFYEFLIRLALTSTSESLEDIPLKETLLAELSWYINDSGGKNIDFDSYRVFTDKHWEIYRLNDDEAKVTDELNRARILLLDDNQVGFRYKYLYYYYLARKIANELDTDEMQKVVDDLITNIHVEDNANILMFLSYLTRNEGLLRKVLEGARTVLSDFEPCDMEGDAGFVDRLQDDVPELFLPEGDPRRNRKEVLRQRDALEAGSSASSKAEEAGEEGDEDPGEFARALRFLEVLGQIVRSFSGSLPGDIKRDLTAECFSIGLRALNFMYCSMEETLPEVVGLVREKLNEARSELSEEQQIDFAQKLMFWVAWVLTFGMIERIGSAVGSERLVRTYQEVEQGNDSLATQFVLLSIRLDYFQSFPEKMVETLYDRVKTSPLGVTLLRFMVLRHFYLFPRSFRLRQSVCRVIGVAFRPPAMAGTPSQQRALRSSAPAAIPAGGSSPAVSPAE